MERSVKYPAPNFKALFAFAIALFMLPVAAVSAGPSTNRPLSDFLSTQGNFALVTPPIACSLFPLIRTF